MDHLGSTRVVLNGSGTVVSQIDNAPFGEQIAVTGVRSRKQFIDKEKDGETGTANHGVRQYDPETGVFRGMDMLWEKYRALTPYHYATNTPLNVIDADGKDIIVLNDKEGADGLGHNAVIVGNDEKGWIYYSKDGIDKVTGEQRYRRLDFETLGAFLAKKDISSRYEHGAWIETDEATDAKAQEFADKDYKTPYNGAFNNCGDLVDKTLKSVGIATYPAGSLVNIPNVQFNLIVTQGKADKMLHIDHERKDDPVYLPTIPQKKK